MVSFSVVINCVGHTFESVAVTSGVAVSVIYRVSHTDESVTWAEHIVEFITVAVVVMNLVEHTADPTTVKAGGAVSVISKVGHAGGHIVISAVCIYWVEVEVVVSVMYCVDCPYESITVVVGQKNGSLSVVISDVSVL